MSFRIATSTSCVCPRQLVLAIVRISSHVSYSQRADDPLLPMHHPPPSPHASLTSKISRSSPLNSRFYANTPPPLCLPFSFLPLDSAAHGLSPTATSAVPFIPGYTQIRNVFASSLYLLVFTFVLLEIRPPPSPLFPSYSTQSALLSAVSQRLLLYRQTPSPTPPPRRHSLSSQQQALNLSSLSIARSLFLSCVHTHPPNRRASQPTKMKVVYECMQVHTLCKASRSGRSDPISYTGLSDRTDGANGSMDE